MYKKLLALTVASSILLNFVPTNGSIVTAKQNESTFDNPVIWADVPDSDVIRVGDTYYMSSTTMHMNPGVPIMKSKDLVNWEIVNYAYDILEKGDKQTLRNGQNEYGQGSWASSLRYHNGTYYLAVASFSAGKTYIFRTKDIENGEWSRSTLNGVYHDMSLLFDDDGKVYMTYGGGDIQIIELTADATAIKEGGLNKVLIPNASAVAGPNINLPAEGGHIQKINGKYYVSLITWPKNDMRTQLVFRSDTIDGKYEGKVVLKDSGIAQGGMIDTVDGKWYGFLFGDRGAVGRIPYLVPVKWEDGWPVFGIDGKVPKEMAMPVKGADTGDKLVASDEFNNQEENNVTAKNEQKDVASQSLATASEQQVAAAVDEKDLIDNGGFENGQEPWNNYRNATVGVTDKEHFSGSNSLHVYNRKASVDGPAQHITGKVKPGAKYKFSAKIKYTTGPEQKSFNYNIQNGPSWEHIDVMASATIQKGEWGTIQGTYTVPENADTSETFIFFETSYANPADPEKDLMEFYVDDVTFIGDSVPAPQEKEKDGEYDDNGSKLPLVWQWNHNPDNNYWSLSDRAGYLRLTAGHKSTGILDARNTLTQRTFGPESSGNVAVDVSNMKDGDVTGLAAFQKNYGFVGVKKTGTTKSIIMENGSSATPVEVESIPLNQDRIYLKVDFDFKNQTDKAYFYYSLNGVEWKAIGNTLQMSYTLPHFMGYRFALFNYATKTTGGYVDFDYFRVDDKMTGTNPAAKVMKAGLEDVPEVIGAPNIKLEVPVKLDELPKGKYTSVDASFNIPDSLTVTGVDFNSKNIMGDSSYTYSKNNLKLHVKGGNVSFAHKGSDLFATIKLKVKDFVTADRTDVIRTNSIKVEGGDGKDIVYSVHDAVSNIGLKQLDTGAIAKIPGYANPLMSHKFGADPHALVYDGRVYIYLTNDEFEYDANGNVKDNTYNKINTINVISSDDMINWTDHGAIPVAGPNGAAKWATQSWAVSVEHKVIDGKDKFFLYFANNASGIGVITSDSPIGPWTDPLGKPLIGRNDPAAQGVTWLFDPAGFVDDDGQGYLYYGGGVPGNPPTQEQAEHPNTARVIKLSDDMIHTVGEPKVIDAPFLFEASGIHKRNDKYYYSYSTNFSGVRQGDDPKTGEIAYMIGDSPMGPWTYGGTALKNPGAFFGVGGNNHQDFFEFKGQSYITYHAQTLAKALNNAKGYRSPHINKVEYYENGKIKEVKADMKGVSQVANLDPYKRNEAETIGWNSGIKTEKSKAPGSMVESINLNVTDINNGDWVAVSQADFGKNGTASFEASIASTVGGKIEIRVDSPVGEVIGTLDVNPTGGDQDWQLIKTDVKKVSGTHNIFFMFKGEGENNLFNMDYWKFTETE